MSKARAAVIGLGSHGLRHLQAYARIEDVDVVAVCDVQPEAIQRAVTQNQDAHGYSNWTELLKNEKLDIVSIVTNGPTHAPIAVTAAQQGVGHILCEKPMATSIEDAV